VLFKRARRPPGAPANEPSGSYRGLVVYELKDGKVLNQWVYPAG
jgi:hypothetical protein